MKNKKHIKKHENCESTYEFIDMKNKLVLPIRTIYLPTICSTLSAINSTILSAITDFRIEIILEAKNGKYNFLSLQSNKDKRLKPIFKKYVYDTKCLSDC